MVRAHVPFPHGCVHREVGIVHGAQGRSGAHERIDVGDVSDGDFYEAAHVHVDGARRSV